MTRNRPNPIDASRLGGLVATVAGRLPGGRVDARGSVDAGPAPALAPLSVYRDLSRRPGRME